ncbi:elongator complex protein 5 [Phasianus colchicus]|uniref:elongator complex protein 5 n=1 Tax=Phasianus colchicus TaxID=9054 RepID=UPI00129EF1E6|nr:elongator complex protein 5 [Phasianus colchicus]
MLRALVEGGAEGLLWVEDTATCEGRSLLWAFVTAAVKRAEPVDVVLLEVSQEQFGVGLSPEVKKQLRFHDDSSDPRGWLGGSRGRAALWGGGCDGAGPNSMVVVDSLSAALMRERPLVAGRRLRAALGAGRGEGAWLRAGGGRGGWAF